MTEKTKPARMTDGWDWKEKKERVEGLDAGAEDVTWWLPLSLCLAAGVSVAA